MVLKHLKFILTTADDLILTVNLCFEIASQNCNALFIGLSPSLQILNLRFQGGKVALAQFVRLNFSPVRRNDSLANVLADLTDFVLFLVLLLDFLVLHMLSLLPLLTVLLVVAESRSISRDLSEVVTGWRWHRSRVSWRGLRADGRSLSANSVLVVASSIPLGIGRQLSLPRGVSLLSMIRPPESLRPSCSSRSWTYTWPRRDIGSIIG